MIIVYNNIKLKIYWKHQMDKYDRHIGYLPRWSKCYVETLETKRLVIVAETFVNPEDAFSKKIGRKLSFSRAMNGIIMSDNPKLIPILLRRKQVSPDEYNEYLETEKKKAQAIAHFRKPLMLQYKEQMPGDFTNE